MERKTQVIAFANRKGGVGKTTTVYNVGFCLQRRGLRTLLVDMDPQANLSLMCNVEYENSVFDGVDLSDMSTYPVRESNSSRPSVHSLLHGKASFAQTVVRVENSGMDLLPSCDALSQLENAMMRGVSEQAQVKLFTLLGPIIAAVRRDYDFILIDCPPTPGVLTVMSLAAADHVIIPVQCEHLAVAGLRQMLDFISSVSAAFNSKLKVMGIVPTMLVTNSTASRIILDGLKHLKGGDRMIWDDACIRRTSKLSRASLEGRPVFHDSRAAIAQLDYEDLTAKILTHSYEKNK